MRRDLDLMKQLCLAIQDSGHGNAPSKETLAQQLYMSGDHELEVVGYHLWLLIDHGLATGTDVSADEDTSPQGVISSLTRNGHGFCDAARNEAVWQRGLDYVKDNGSNVPFGVFQQVLIELSVEYFKLVSSALTK